MVARDLLACLLVASASAGAGENIEALFVAVKPQLPVVQGRLSSPGRLQNPARQSVVVRPHQLRASSEPLVFLASGTTVEPDSDLYDNTQVTSQLAQPRYAVETSPVDTAPPDSTSTPFLFASLTLASVAAVLAVAAKRMAGKRGDVFGSNEEGVGLLSGLLSKASYAGGSKQSSYRWPAFTALATAGEAEDSPGEKVVPDKWVYYLGEMGKGDKDLVGGKGANLSEMTKIGLPIPTGFTITTRACIEYSAQGKTWPSGLSSELDQAMAKMEEISGKKFGDKDNALLVSVRSGAKFSMPGMMDTVLNLGLNENVVQGLAAKKGERFAYDSYRRFIMMYGDVVKDVDKKLFDHELEQLKRERGYTEDTQITADELKELVTKFIAIYEEETNEKFPEDPRDQLEAAINGVFRSWDNPRADVYRKMHNIPYDIGTAVSVQEMVYGNMGDDCATGVAFTRNPSTGDNNRYGEFLPNAQGEDVVAGVRTPFTIDKMKDTFPECSAQLYEIFKLLEDHYDDMQDIEFTIEQSKLFILQTRNGKRTARAAVKMAADMVEEGRISQKEAIMRLEADQIDSLLHRQLEPKALKEAETIGEGLPASPGAAVGQICFSADDAVAAKETDQKVLLVRNETSPEDILGMAASQGILTARGGMTSHAAVVARGMNLPCISGCADITVDEKNKTVVIDGKVYHEGDFLSLDGNTGKFYAGQLPTLAPQLDADFHTVMGWCDEFADIEVRANADNETDAAIASEFGAKGVGLCRTEHMFFQPDRILAVREMIIADTEEARRKALDKLLPFQRKDFYGILGSMSDKPVIIRLIDPPLHEFLPHEEKDLQILADDIAGGDVSVIKRKVDSLHEMNPMLGFRGCRLGVVYPEINEMQIRAIFEASLELLDEGKVPLPQIEVPLVGKMEEFLAIKAIVQRIAKETRAEGKVKYEIGTMVEVPRAALMADQLATEVEFMSFGTNDLTQMTCGFSRDDAGRFLKPYVQKGIFERDPFETIDQQGVGRLMRLTVALARPVRPDIDIGICGEHGGDPASVDFCHRAGLNNVSCSPYRVPVARLAAAQAAIAHGPYKPETPSEIFANVEQKEQK